MSGSRRTHGKGSAVQLELEDADAVLLKRILEQHLGNLRMEISNTENYEWRRALHADEDRLKRLIALLEA